ncbi:MAG TPA: Gldg family protein, partial [Candidatus Eisenbacteria bacterium]
MAGTLFRSVKKGGSLLVTGALFLGILVMINVAAGRLAWRSDWTGENRYSLSPQTHQILKSLDRDVSIMAFLQTNDPDQDELRRLFDEYASS